MTDRQYKTCENCLVEHVRAIIEKTLLKGSGQARFGLLKKSRTQETLHHLKCLDSGTDTETDRNKQN